VNSKEHSRRRQKTAPALAAVEQETLEQLQNRIIFLCETKSDELEEFVSRLQVFAIKCEMKGALEHLKKIELDLLGLGAVAPDKLLRPMSVTRRLK
jgi:hypothetical protein